MRESAWKPGQCYKLRAARKESDKYGPSLEIDQIRLIRFVGCVRMRKIGAPQHACWHGRNERVRNRHGEQNQCGYGQGQNLKRRACLRIGKQRANATG